LELFTVAVLDGTFLILEVDILHGYKPKPYSNTKYLESLNKYTGSFDF